MTSFLPAPIHVTNVGDIGSSKVQAIANAAPGLAAPGTTTLASLAAIFGAPQTAFVINEDQYNQPVTKSNMNTMIESFYNNRQLTVPAAKVNLKLMFSPFAPLLAAFYPVIITNEQKILIVQHFIDHLPHTPTAHHVPGRTLTVGDRSFGVTKQAYTLGILINTEKLLDTNQAPGIMEDAINGVVYSIQQTLIICCLEWCLAQGYVRQLANDRGTYDPAADFLCLTQHFAALNRGADLWFNRATEAMRIVRTGEGRSRVLLITPSGRANSITQQLRPIDAEAFNNWVFVQDPVTRSIVRANVEYAPDVPPARKTIAANLELHELPNIPINPYRTLPNLLDNAATVGQYYGMRQIKLVQTDGDQPSEYGNVFFLYNPESDMFEAVPYTNCLDYCGIWSPETGEYSHNARDRINQYNLANRAEHTPNLQDVRRLSKTPSFLPPQMQPRNNDEFMFAIYRRTRREWDLARIIGELYEHHLPNTYALWAAQRILAVPNFGDTFTEFINDLQQLVTYLNSRPPNQKWFEAIIDANQGAYMRKEGDSWVPTLEMPPQRKQRYAVLQQLKGNAFGSLNIPLVPPADVPVDCFFAGYGNGPGIRTLANLAQQTSAYGRIPELALKVVARWQNIEQKLLNILGESKLLCVEEIPAFFGHNASDPFTAFVCNVFGGLPLFLRVTQPENIVALSAPPQQQQTASHLAVTSNKLFSGPAMISQLLNTMQILNISEDRAQVLAAQVPILHKLLTGLYRNRNEYVKWPIMKQLMFILAYLATAHPATDPLPDVQRIAADMNALPATNLDSFNDTYKLLADTMQTQQKINTDVIGPNVSNVILRQYAQARLSIIEKLLQGGVVLTPELFTQVRFDQGDVKLTISTAGTISYTNMISSGNLANQPQPAVDAILAALKALATPISLADWIGQLQSLHRQYIALVSVIEKSGSSVPVPDTTQAPSRAQAAAFSYIRAPLTILHERSEEYFTAKSTQRNSYPIALPGDYRTGYGVPALTKEALPTTSNINILMGVLAGPISEQRKQYEVPAMRPSGMVFNDIAPRSAQAFGGVVDVYAATTGQDGVPMGTFLGISTIDSALLQSTDAEEWMDGPMHGRLADINALTRYSTPAQKIMIMLYLTLPLTLPAMKALATQRQLLPFDPLVVRFIQVATTNDILLGDGAGQIYASPSVVALANDNKHMEAFMRSDISFGILPRTENGVLLLQHTQLQHLIGGMNTIFATPESIDELQSRAPTSSDPSLISIVVPVTEALPSVISWAGGPMDRRIADTFKLPITQGGVSMLNAFYRHIYGSVMMLNTTYAGARSHLFDRTNLGDNKETFYPKMETILDAIYTSSPFSHYIAAGPYMYKNRDGREVQVSGIGPLSQRFEQMPGAQGPYITNNGSMYFPTTRMESPQSVVAKTYV